MTFPRFVLSIFFSSFIVVGEELLSLFFLPLISYKVNNKRYIKNHFPLSYDFTHPHTLCVLKNKYIFGNFIFHPEKDFLLSSAIFMEC